MSKKRGCDPAFDPSRDRWKVDVPAKRNDTGKRFRAWFKTRKAARDFIDGLLTDASATIPASLAADADTARRRLDAADIDLTLAEAIAELVEARKVLGSCGSLVQAAQAYRDQHETRTTSQVFRKAVEFYLQSKEETLRPSTLASYKDTLSGPTFAVLQDKLMSDVSSMELTDILRERRPTARATHLRNLRVFWKWASKEPRGWAEMAPLDALEFRSESSEGEIQILRADEVRALLTAAERYDPAAAVAYALGVFAGIRKAELERLTRRNILDDYIEIGADIAKKHTRRLVPINPTLRAWLECYLPSEGEKDELLVPANWREVDKACRRLAGWNVEARLLSDPPKATRGQWPQNALRHTCASVLVAMGETLEALTFQFGHAGGQDLLRRHYVARLTKKEAIAILAVGPKGKKLSNLSAA